MAAGAITLLLKVYKFPNGGGGFWGFDTTKPSGRHALPRPSIALGDIAYFRYSLVVVSLMFLLVTWHIKGKPGRAWASIRQSQATAVSAGVHTTLYKLWAFALSAFITGVAGALLAAGPGGVSVNQFPVEGSIILLAVVLMGGVYTVWGAVVAAFLLRILPRLLEQKIGLSSEVLTMLFGLGVIQVLLTTPGGIVSDLARLGDAVKRRFSRADAGGGGTVVIEISGMTVRFGGVTPIDNMTLTLGAGTNGLIGPNGAGKTTFFNVLSGFVRPQAGTVTAFGVDLLAMPPFKRARWGVRRTFQTEQAVANLTVFENVLLIEEQSSRRSTTRRRGRHRRRGIRRARPEDPSCRSARSAPPSAAWSRWPARSSANRASCCSTSPPPGCRTTRPTCSATSSGRSPSAPARWWCSSTTTWSSCRPRADRWPCSTSVG